MFATFSMLSFFKVKVRVEINLSVLCWLQIVVACGLMRDGRL
jgi:hypothetical protein